jgi:hypothetical protein
MTRTPLLRLRPQGAKLCDQLLRTGVWNKLGELNLPVLVANGAHDTS